ncbi:MAG: hypothetical protein NXI18_03290 [Alphaproteobacteria bacterium]|nr:hypothetical protein [Alphaproteobacteria bacterium]
MFGKAKSKPGSDTTKSAGKTAVKLGSAIFGEEELEVRELHIKGIRIPNPGEGNIIAGQRFHFLLKLGEGESAPVIKVEAHAMAASEKEVIGKFSEMADDEKRLLALHMKALRQAGAVS